jgi:hypothetical protein
MNRITIIVIRGLVLSVLLFAGTNFQAQSASPSTPVCGSLSSDTTWSLVNSPYDVCGSGVTVPSGVTLTIDPGVTVQFDAVAGNKLNVQGTLIASGTVTQTITLTGVVASPGTWDGISANGIVGTPAHVNLNYVTLDYGGVSGSSGAQVYADQAVVMITHSLVRNSAGNGVYISLNGLFEAHSTNFVDNAQNAIQLNQPSTYLLMTDLSASGNGTDGVRLVGSSVMHGQKRWTFPGIPYIVEGPVRTDLGDVLTIDPGNTLQFTSTGWLYIRGQLNALGTPSEPITLTAQTQTPGGWSGLYIDGGTHEAVANLDYVTIEYAGSDINGANIEVANGKLIVHHSLIRYSMTDGVRFDYNWGGSIIESQIVGNTLYGVRNITPTRAVLATNNWWGDAGGPQSDVTECSTGQGDKITAGVLFQPVVTDTLMIPVFPLSDAPILTLSPRRWYAPANGVTRVYFDITVRDGNGAPLPGRKVRLNSSLGSVVDGGITGADGKTLAYLTSQSAGDADVNAALDTLNTCEGALSPISKITFTPPFDFTDLMPNSAAPYVNSDLIILPKPTVVGITSTLTAELTNPYTLPITVDVSFDYVQSSIGLVFGPIAEVPGVIIPANETLTIVVPWIPSVSGHYCFQVTYVIVGIGNLGLLSPPLPEYGKEQANSDSLLGALLDAGTKAPLAQAENALAAVNWFIDQAADTDPFGLPLYAVQQQITWMMEQAAEISRNLVGDPPRQDYNSVSIPTKIALPPAEPPVGVSPALAAAMDNLRQALADVVYYGRGSNTSLDRYAGASEAEDMLWASQQSNALLYYNTKFGSALITATQAITGFYQVLVAENIPDIEITINDVISYQNRLITQGFSADELAGYQSIGLSPEEIESIRQRYIAADPEKLTGSPRAKLSDLANRLNYLAQRLLYPEVFAPSIHVGGGHGLQIEMAGSGNTMAQINEIKTTIQLGNPFTQTVTIDLNVRPVDLPADWMASVSPAQVTLLPGEQITVTLSIVPGSPALQGLTPSVAIEGYVNGLLLGGVAVNVVVPRYIPFDGTLHVYLPLLRK